MNKRSISLFLLLLISSCGFSQKQLQLHFTNEPDSSIRIVFADTVGNDYLKELRVNYNLIGLTQSATSDKEKVMIVCDWVSKLWQHNGSNLPKKSDPISIIEEANSGKQFRCVEYGIVVSGCLNSIGIPARVLGLKRADVATAKTGAGHVVAEAYVKELNKWIFIDGQWNVIPFIDNEPLNAIELQHAISNKDKRLRFWSSSGEVDKKTYLKWIAPYLYYFDISLDQRIPLTKDRNLVETKSMLMLMTTGEKAPTAFQRTPVSHAGYLSTYSTEVFYQAPR